ncbi:MAG: hypothetical protein KC586_13895 [Myxococcales bacterium]|nr:hypothetical protein [Myxococcales bacterium]
MRVLLLCLAACASTPLPPPPAAPVAERAPTPTSCTVGRQPHVGGVLSASFVEALRDDVTMPVERGVCACAGPHALAASSSLRVNVLVDPNVGRVQRIATDLDHGEGPDFDWPGFERCLASELREAELPLRPLGTCAEPGGSGGRVMLSLVVHTR